MVIAEPQPKRKPWDDYKGDPRWKLLQPGYGGVLAPDELEYIQSILKADDALAFWWGFKKSMSSRSAAAIEWVAEFGSCDERRINVQLTRNRASRVRPD